MSFIDLKNKKGTADKKPPHPYTSWLDFWEKKKKEKANDCKVSGCSNNAELGGHVIKPGGHGKEYILPMCSSCNNKKDDEAFESCGNDLVSVK